MLLVTYRPATSTKRWKKLSFLTHSKKKWFYNFFKYKTHHRKTLLGSTSISGIKRMRKTQLWKTVNTKLNIFMYVAFDFCYQNKPLKEFFFAKNIFNHVKLFPFTYGIYPGFKLYPTEKYLTKFSRQIICLNSIPLNSAISFVFNFKNLKMTFAKSSGSTAFRKKNIKKTKLVYVELASGCLIALSNYTLCVLAPTVNLKLNKNVLGKWGLSLTNTKKINVRGVAKNPVDHPNGGRTKAKQPELSPWGWVAKLNK